MPQIREKVYRDLSITFTPHPVTGKITVLENEAAVKRALKNLILTNRFERPYRPEYGGDVISQLFENFDAFTEHTMRKNIKLAIQNYEPRVEVIKINIEPDTIGQIIKVTVVFRVLNSTEPTEVNFFVERIR